MSATADDVQRILGTERNLTAAAERAAARKDTLARMANAGPGTAAVFLAGLAAGLIIASATPRAINIYPQVTVVSPLPKDQSRFEPTEPMPPRNDVTPLTIVPKTSPKSGSGR